MAIIVPIVSTFDPKGINKAVGEIKKAEGGLNKFAKSTQILGASFKDTGKTLTRNLTVPIVALGAVAVKAFADFDAALTQSTAIMGNVSEETRDKMSAAARDVAKNLGISHKAAAESYYFLASAGLDAEKSIAALPAVAAFAKAGMFDMALATDLATDAQSALGLTSKDATENLTGLKRVTDVLVKANTLANASVEQFSTSLTNKAGAAIKAVGKDIEEGVAVLAAFADQGIKGEYAGTQLAIVMRDLQTASLNNSAAFQANSVAVYDATGDMRNMADIIGDLEKSLAGATDKQKKMTLASLGFTDKSQGALLALLGTSEKIRQYEKDLRSAGGTTDEVANKQMKSFSEQVNILKSELTDLAIDVGPTLIDSFIKPLMGFLKNLTIMWSELSPEVQKNIVKFIGIVAIVGPLLILLGSLIGAISTIAGAVGFFTVALGLNAKALDATGAAAGRAAVGVTVFGRAVRIAMAGTGIGLLLVAIGYIANKFMDAKNSAVDFGETVEVVTYRVAQSARGAAVVIKGTLVATLNAASLEATRVSDSVDDVGRKNVLLRKQLGKPYTTPTPIDPFAQMFDELPKATSEVKELSAASKAAELQMQKLGDSLKDNNDILAQAKDAYKSFKDGIVSVVKGIINFGDAATAETGSFLDNLIAQASSAREFAERVKTLISMGLSESAIGQVLSAGAEVGTKIADEIIAGGATIVDQVNTLVSATESVANIVGESAATQFYQSGITAGQALVDGVKAAIYASGFSIDASGNIINPSANQASTAVAAVAAKTATTAKSKTSSKPKPSGTSTPKPVAPVINQGILNKLKTIPMMAAGGIVNQPTLAMIGEAGPEAVVPLSGRNSGLGNTYNITVNAGIGTNGAQVGKEIVDAIKRFEKSSGPVFASA